MCRSGDDGARRAVADSGCPTWGARNLSPDEAVSALAKIMRDTMEMYDPTGAVEWDKLSPEDRGFYRDVVLTLLDMRPLIEKAWLHSNP